VAREVSQGEDASGFQGAFKTFTPETESELIGVSYPNFLYRKGKLTLLRLERHASRTVSRGGQGNFGVV
jgi:hypothetical protein